MKMCQHIENNINENLYQKKEGEKQLTNKKESYINFKKSKIVGPDWSSSSGQLTMECGCPIHKVT